MAASSLKWLAWAMAWTVLLSACAERSYLVLLPDDDGKVGQVTLKSQDGETLLDQKNQGADVKKSGATYAVSEHEIRRDFGAALDASPAPAARYLIYFEDDHRHLTPSSAGNISRIRDEVRRRAGADVSVIGHTDTLGDAKANYQLGLTRAKGVAAILAIVGMPSDHLSVTSHGEKNLLFQTPDETPDRRNWGVEVFVR